jgi:hypothetical protein
MYNIMKEQAVISEKKPTGKTSKISQLATKKAEE